MDGAWIGVIGTLGGGLLVGGISWLQKRQELLYQREQDDRRVLRKKIEQLHGMLSAYVEISLRPAREMSILRHLCNPTSSSETFLPEFERISRTFTEPLGVMNTLQRLYAPELGEIWHTLLGANIEYNNSLAALMRWEIEMPSIQNMLAVVHARLNDAMRRLEEIAVQKALLKSQLNYELA